MASVLVNATRYASANAFRPAKYLVSVKQFHVSLPTLCAIAAGDLFDYSDESAPQTTHKKSAKSPHNHADARERKFHELRQFVHDRTGRVKTVKAGQVRATAWLRLFQLASKSEHLEAVVEMFPRWKESGKYFTPLDIEMFIRRCEELKCPPLALNVFGNHPKYGVALSSFPAARNLLHSFYRNYPLGDTIATVSLFGVNNLPPVTDDPASCAMLYAACLQSKSKHASLLGRDIRIALQKLLRETTPFSKPTERVLCARHSLKPNLWLLEALQEIKEMKREQGRGSWWITEWIARGEGRVLPPLAERRYHGIVGKQWRSSIPAAGSAPQQLSHAHA